MKRIFAAIAILLVGFVSGMLFQKLHLVGKWRAKHSVPDAAVIRQEVLVSSVPSRRFVIVAAGQSNAGNSGETRYTPTNAVFNLYAGKLYRATDPLLGASGNGGSVWGRMADALIAKGECDAVVIALAAMGGTGIRRWEDGGELHPLILHALDDCKSAGLTVTHILWHQGERDASDWMRGSDYQASFRSIVCAIRKRGVAAPVYVSVATRNGNTTSTELAAAQAGLVDDAGIFAGPDTDTITARFDEMHFSTTGLTQASELWVKCLTHPSQSGKWKPGPQ